MLSGEKEGRSIVCPDRADVYYRYGSPIVVYNNLKIIRSNHDLGIRSNLFAKRRDSCKS